MKLKPLLILAGAAGAVAAIVKSRGGAKQVIESAPQPLRDAAQQAGATVQRAVENAPEPIQKAVDKVTPDAGGAASEERYEPPAEGLAQPPKDSGEAPSDDVPVKQAGASASEPGEQLNTPDHAPPEGAVMPDTASDPLVDAQTKAAAGDAGSIGGNVDEMAASDASFPEDPEMRPVVEGSGDDNEETFEARESVERSQRETET
jgi:hypothetical protein